MKWLIKAIFKVIKILISLIVAPLDLIISNLAPDLSAVVSSVTSFFNYITTPILWVKSWLPFTTTFWTILVSVLVFKYTVPMAVHTIKVVVAWYNKLKP